MKTYSLREKVKGVAIASRAAVLLLQVRGRTKTGKGGAALNAKTQRFLDVSPSCQFPVTLG